jgi:predicted PurR-regulated permease PerM
VLDRSLLDNRPFTFDRVIRLGITVALIWGLVWLLGYLSDVLIPFVIAFLLAYLVHPLVMWLRRRIRNHVLAVITALALVLLALVLAVMVVAPLVVREAAHMGQVLSDVVHNSTVAERAAKSLPPDLWAFIKEQAARDEVQRLFRTEKFWAAVQDVAKKVMPGLWGFLAGAASVLTGLVGLGFILIYLVFLLIDYRKVQEGWRDLLPPAYRDGIVDFVKEFDAAMSRYFRAQALVALITGVLLAVGFSLLGLPMGILLGLVIGLFNMAPYLQALGFPPAVLLALVHGLEVGGNLWVHVGLVCLVFLVVQLIQDLVLTPRIMGEVTGLSPAMILLSLSVWGKLLGMLGLLIGLPMTCLLLAYYRRMLRSPALAEESPQGFVPPAPPPKKTAGLESRAPLPSKGAARKKGK